MLCLCKTVVMAQDLLLQICVKPYFAQVENGLEPVQSK